MKDTRGAPKEGVQERVMMALVVLLSRRSVLGEAFISVGTPVELPRLGDRPKGPVVRTSLLTAVWVVAHESPTDSCGS